jgi:hypothetical protein
MTNTDPIDPYYRVQARRILEAMQEEWPNLYLEIEEDRARAMIARILKYDANDELWDCTDAAHPAWWRGNDRGVEAMCEIIEKTTRGENAGEHCYGLPRISAIVKNLNSLLWIK